MGRSRDLMAFTKFIRGKAAGQILDLIHHIVMRWPNATVERISSARQTEFLEPVEGRHAGVKTVILMGHPLLREAMSTTGQPLQAIETMATQIALRMISENVEQFQDILFEVVCEALGLTLPANKFGQSLSLIVYPSENPAIGICRQMEPGLSTNSSCEEGTTDCITVCGDAIRCGSGYKVLEAAKVNVECELLPTYTGVGIWVPQGVTPWQDIGSLTDESMPNALLI